MHRFNSYLGVDLGSGGIKIVELAYEKGVDQLITYSYTKSPFEQIKSINDQDLKHLGALLNIVARRAKVTNFRCITALPTFSVFSSIITLADVDKKDLQNAIRLEAKKVVPLPIEQMILDSQIISEQVTAPEKLDALGVTQTISTGPVKSTKVLLTAAPKDLVQKYVEVFKSAGFQLLRLETEAFALTRSLLGNDKSVSMIIDLGASNTNISVVDQGIPILNRGVDLGGLQISKLISQALKIPLDQAEQFKKDWHHLAGGNTEIPEVVKNGLAPLINEVKYIFNFYQSQSRYIGLTAGPTEKIEKIILTGGAASIPFLDMWLSRLLNVKVFVGDPWSSVAYAVDLKEVLSELGPALSVAVGLALRRIE